MFFSAPTAEISTKFVPWGRLQLQLSLSERRLRNEMPWQYEARSMLTSSGRETKLTDRAPYYRRRADMCRQNAEAIYDRDKVEWFRLAEHWLRLSEQVDPPRTKRALGSRDAAG